MDHMENNEILEPEQEAVPSVPETEAAPESLQPEQETVQFVLQSDEKPEPIQPEQPEAPAGPACKKRKKKTAGKRLLTTLLAVVLLLAMGAGIGSLACYSRLAAQEKRTEQLLTDLNQQIAQLQEELNSKSFTGNGNSISGSANDTADGTLTPGQVYADVVDSVVAITTEIAVTNGSTVTTAISYGTGFVLTEDGFVVTNYHVVEGGTTLTVTTSDGTDHGAILRGYDSTNDIAVLKIEAQGLQAVRIGSSSDLIVGDQVVVIGNPLGELTSTLTVGFISGKDRIITTDGSQINMLQTDAAVNSGNSGGPIFNMNGQVVGIITAKYSGLSTSGATIEGIGFAIPMDDVISKITDLKDYGYITGAYLGVSVQDMDQTVAEYYGLPLGAYVYSTVSGYCADAAGVQSKDIIIGLGDYTITGINSLTRALQNFEAGETTTITVWRSGLEIELEITLDEKPH